MSEYVSPPSPNKSRTLAYTYIYILSMIMMLAICVSYQHKHRLLTWVPGCAHNPWKPQQGLFEVSPA